ncbi:hypothetical protein Hanom_Chr08g00684481 [Helianthus anomalus]
MKLKATKTLVKRHLFGYETKGTERKRTTVNSTKTNKAEINEILEIQDKQHDKTKRGKRKNFLIFIFYSFIF